MFKTKCYTFIIFFNWSGKISGSLRKTGIADHLLLLKLTT